MKKIVAILSILIVAACSSSTVPGNAPSVVPTAGQGSKGGDANDVTNLVSKLGVIDFKSVKYGFARTLGIDPEACNATYDKIKNLLPQGNDVNTFTASTMNSVSELAVCACEKSLADPAASAQVLPGVNLNGVSSDVFSDRAKKEALVKRYIYLAWGKEVSKYQKQTEIVNELVNLADQVIATEPVNAATTKRVALAVCIATLSSFPATVK